jgi:hypothetical protein
MARGKYCIVVMADLSDDLELLPRIKERMDGGCDAVVCSRFMEGGETRNYPFLKMVSNRLFNWTVGIAFDLKTGDASNAYKGYRTAKARELPIESRGFEVSPEILIRMKLADAKICEMPASWEDRSAGEAKFRLENTFIRYFLLFIKMFKTAYLGG